MLKKKQQIVSDFSSRGWNVTKTSGLTFNSAASSRKHGTDVAKVRRQAGIKFFCFYPSLESMFMSRRIKKRSQHLYVTVSEILLCVRRRSDLRQMSITVQHQLLYTHVLMTLILRCFFTSKCICICSVSSWTSGHKRILFWNVSALFICSYHYLFLNPWQTDFIF